MTGSVATSEPKRVDTRWMIEVLALAALYWLSERLGSTLTIPGDSVTSLWPPAGVALAAVLLWGRRAWLGICLGAFISNCLYFISHYTGQLPLNLTHCIAYGLAMTSGATLAALAGGLLVRQAVGPRNPLERVRDVCVFIALGGVMSSLISASVGVVTLCAAGITTWPSYGRNWLIWWLGDAAGVFTVTPLFLIWGPGQARRTAIRWLETFACFSLLAVATWCVFMENTTPLFSGRSLSFVLIPFLVWPAIRFGQRGAAAAVALIASLAVWGTIHHLGPFTAGATQESLVLMEMFLIVIVLTALCMAASATEHQRAETALLQTLNELDGLVRERTSELTCSNETLQTEVAERKRAEVALRWGEAQLRATIESTADAILAVDNHGKVVNANRRFAEFWRIPPSLMESGDDHALLEFARNQLTNPDAFLAKVAELYASDSVAMDTLNFKDGRVFERYSFPMTMEGAVSGRVWSFRDITERVRAGLALQASEERYRLLADNAEDFVTMYHADGRRLYLSPSFYRVTGWTPEEMQSADWRAHIHADDLPAAEQSREANFQGRPTTHESRIQCKNGSLLWMETRCKPLLDAAGKVEKLVLWSRDITERKITEGQLRQTLKMNAVGQLAGGVAHDFNNQLAAILGYADALSRRLEAPDMHAMAEHIATAARRSSDLTRKLLAFARKGQYQLLPVDMHKILGETIEMIERTVDKRITVQKSLKSAAPIISGDPSQIQNALLNLALNARDAMPEGGTLTFDTQDVTLDADFCARHQYDMPAGDYIRISVSDTGCGMTPEVKKHLFEPFFTTKPVGKGTGMGLASVYGTVKNHQGAVNVYSEPGLGTNFKVYLPRANHVVPQSGTTSSVLTAVSGLRILVVEDEEIVRTMLVYILCNNGHEVKQAIDGREAVDLYQLHWRSIDVVILDMVMPRMNGRDTFRALKQINPAVRAVLASGFGLNNEVQAILSEGVLGFIQKPFDLQQLQETLSKAMKNRKPVQA